MTTNKTIEEMAKEYLSFMKSPCYFEHRIFLAGAKAQKELSDKRDSVLISILECRDKTLYVLEEENRALKKKLFSFKNATDPGKKQSLLNNVSDLMVFADQLLMMEEYQDRLNGSNMKEYLEGVKNIVEESLL